MALLNKPKGGILGNKGGKSTGGINKKFNLNGTRRDEPQTANEYGGYNEGDFEVDEGASFEIEGDGDMGLSEIVDDDDLQYGAPQQKRRETPSFLQKKSREGKGFPTIQKMHPPKSGSSNKKVDFSMKSRKRV